MVTRARAFSALSSHLTKNLIYVNVHCLSYCLILPSILSIGQKSHTVKTT